MTSSSKSPLVKTLGAAMAASRISQNSLARAAGTSQPYVSQVMAGQRLPSAEWLDLVATAMKLSDERRGDLHRAAARAHGFKIDLT
jgi:transcriptional regulator with XRE-family HTH domain